MRFYRQPGSSLILVITMFIIGFIAAKTNFWYGLFLFLMVFSLSIGYVVLFHYVGMALMMRGKLDAAITYYTFLLNVPGNKVLIYTRRAALRNATGDIEGAIADYSAAIKHTKETDPSLFGIRGALYLGKRDYQHALQDSDQLLQLHPVSEIGYANRAAAKMFLGDVGGAIDDCNAGLELTKSPSGTALLYNNRGTAFRLTGEYAEAMANYNLAMSTALSDREKIVIHPTISTNQGILYYLQEDFDNARVYFQQAHNLNPTFSKALVSLAAARYKLGQMAAVKQIWNDLLNQEPRYDDIKFLEGDLNLPKEILGDVADMMQMLSVVTKY